MPRPRIADPSPEQLAEALRIYIEAEIPLPELASRLRISLSTLRTRRKVWGWPARTERAPQPRAPETSPPESPAPSLSADPAEPCAGQARRLERLVARRIDLLEAEAEAGRDPDPDRTDRRLIQLERLLANLRKGRGSDGDADTSPPARSVAELRDELLRHLERVRQHARAGRLSRNTHGG